MKLKTRDMTLIAMMAALICVAGPLSVFVGPIPVTLSNFAVYLAAAVLGAKRGTISVALFLLIGAIGVPVFSGFTGGLQKLAGPTGGYLIGYLPGVFIGGLAVKDGQTSPEKKWLLPALLVAATLVIYILGTAWFVIQSGKTLAAALSLCVLPFLPGDALKIAAASLLAWPIRRAIYRK